MVGQRFIQLLENHPWFEVAWLAASDRSSGKLYGDAAKWKLDTALPERIARMIVSPAVPDGAPKIIFAALDADIAREMEPAFAAAGCAVVSNSSAFRMYPDVPLVIPEVNADHLPLIEEQSWRKASGGYIVTNPNCSAIGLVLALKPIQDIFGIEAIFVSTMQAVSGAGYPGVASLDILGNVVPFIKNEEEKLQEEVGKLLGRLAGGRVELLDANRVAQRRSSRAADCFGLSNDGAELGLDWDSVERLTFIGLCLVDQSSILQRVQSGEEQKVTAFNRRHVTVKSRRFGSADDFAFGVSCERERNCVDFNP